MFWSRQERAQAGNRSRHRFSACPELPLAAAPSGCARFGPLGGTPCGRLTRGSNQPCRCGSRTCRRFGSPNPLRSAHAIRVPPAATFAVRIPTPPADRGQWADAVPRSPEPFRWKPPKLAWLHRCCRVVPAELAVTNEEPENRTCQAWSSLAKDLVLSDARRTGLTFRCITACPAFFPRDALRTSTLA
jgi:hypothetical protein